MLVAVDHSLWRTGTRTPCRVCYYCLYRRDNRFFDRHDHCNAIYHNHHYDNHDGKAYDNFDNDFYFYCEQETLQNNRHHDHHRNDHHYSPS